MHVNRKTKQKESTSVLLIVRPKCTLAASHALVCNGILFENF